MSNEGLILYSTGCPKCEILKEKIGKMGIKYEVVTNIDDMKKENILSVPMLRVGNKLLDFEQAIKTINSWC